MGCTGEAAAASLTMDLGLQGQDPLSEMKREASPTKHPVFGQRLFWRERTCPPASLWKPSFEL
jgi:hypothetical protein